MNRDEIAALEVGDELDAVVASLVLGWEMRTSDGFLDWARSWRGERGWVGEGQAVCIDGPFASCSCPPLSDRIEAAWIVVDHMRFQGDLRVRAAFCDALEDIRGEEEYIFQLTPLLVCQAALIAVNREDN